MLGCRLDKSVHFPVVNDQQLAFARTEDGTIRLIVLINKGSDEAEVNIPLHQWPNPANSHWADQLSAKRFQPIDDQIQITIGANKTMWLLPKDDVCEGIGN